VKKATEGGVKEEEKGPLGRAEAHIFLQMVAAFALKDKFDQEFLRSLFVANRRRKELAKFACVLGFEESVAGNDDPTGLCFLICFVFNLIQ
jgi:hypothetical protein